jgi:MFS family permease
LFSIVRLSSLKSLGYEGDDLLAMGVRLINAQMLGMLVGGVLWGMLGDKRGRLSVLFGSIITYSLANLANGLVSNVTEYTVLRFIAGVGLAGELGAGITLVAEILPKHLRGYGTAIVATIGVSGAIFGGLFGAQLPWRYAFFVGGGLGLVLLFLRATVFESIMFNQCRKANVMRGSFWQLFTPERRGRFVRCILIGVPIWYVLGILMTFSPEFGRALGVEGSVVPGVAVAATYAGFVFGDFFSGFLSQAIRSRKKVVFGFLLLTAGVSLGYLLVPGLSLQQFYAVCGFLGFAGGYWAVFVTIAAEQFGTNLRSTVATTVPNFIRFGLVGMNSSFLMLKGHVGLIPSTLCS